MPLSKEEFDASLRVLKSLDEAIEKGPWEASLLLKGIGKKLREARERFIRNLQLEEYANKEQIEKSNTEEQFILVYISLYQAEGANINKWQSVVNTLAGYNVTRPVYQTEQDVQTAIRTKEFKQNDAYVIVRILKDDIRPYFSEKPPVDRLGHPLLVLREGSIKLENVTEFVHQSGRYLFKNGILIKQQPKEE